MSKTGNQSNPSINNDPIKFAIIFAKNKPSFVFTKNRMVILSAGVPYLGKGILKTHDLFHDKAHLLKFWSQEGL